MAAGPPAEIIPHFQEPESTVSPAIKSLLHEKVVVENGISYAEYKGFGPCDPTEMKKSTKNALFMSVIPTPTLTPDQCCCILSGMHTKTTTSHLWPVTR